MNGESFLIYERMKRLEHLLRSWIDLDGDCDDITKKLIDETRRILSDPYAL